MTSLFQLSDNSPVEKILAEIMGKSQSGEGSSSSDQSGGGDFMNATSDTGQNSTKSASADKGKQQQAQPQLPQQITPHYLTDMILNMGQVMPVTPAAPMQNGKAAGPNASGLLKLLGLGGDGVPSVSDSAGAVARSGLIQGLTALL